MSIGQLLAAGRFFARLPFFLRNRISLPEARAAIRARLEQRAARLLDRIRGDVFLDPGSAWHRLFRHAGCEFGDVESAVRKDGVEAALDRLFRAGIYLSIDEFKGRVPVIRGSLRLDTGPDSFRFPRASGDLTVSSGGSRSEGTVTFLDFRFIREGASNYLLCMDAWGGTEWVKALWSSPGIGARFELLQMAACGDAPRAWFSPIDPADPSSPLALGWHVRGLVAVSAIAGRPLPAPVWAPLTDPTPVVRFLAATLRQGAIPVVLSFPSPAVRVCLAALEQNIDIAGSRFMLVGEPITRARVETIRRAGCISIPRYATIETGTVGYGCPAGEHSDEVHLLQDRYAVIQPGEDNGCGLPPRALLLTALGNRSPFLMINYAPGDQAHLHRRECGCPLHKLGLPLVLHDIRSYEKLTGCGVTFLGTEVIDILETALPDRFGGAPTDYQLVEEEAADGQALLVLVAHPSLGPVDEEDLGRFFLNRLSAGSVSARGMVQMWRDSGTLRIARRPPTVSPAGKILHLHVTCPAASEEKVEP